MTDEKTTWDASAADAWYNATTNLGRPGYDTAGDLSYAGVTLGDTQKAQLYDRDWVTRKIVRKLPETAWQDDIEIEDPTQAERWRELNYLHGNDDGAIMNAAIMARLFGGALLLKGYTSRAGGDLREPIRRGSPELEFLDVITAAEVTVSVQDLYVAPDNPRLHGLPMQYQITRGRYAGAVIHESRVVPFYGPSASPRVISALLASAERDGRLARWGNSIIDILHEEAARYGVTWSALGRMLQESSLVWFKMQGFFDLVKSNDLNTISSRLATLAVNRGPHKTLVLDAGTEEEIGRLTVDFSGVDKVLHQLSMIFTAANDIPLNVFFGSVIGGLNASSDSDQKLWHSYVTAYRTRTLAPRIDALAAEAGITKWRFRELDSPTRKERDEARLRKAQTIKTYFDLGVLPEAMAVDLMSTDLELDPNEVKAELEKETAATAARQNTGLVPLNPEDDPPDDDNP